MEVKRWELMPHVYLTYLPARKFKTGVLSAQFITPLAKETASYNALLPAVLHRGTMRCPDMEQLAAAMDRLYGAQISPTIRKRGETQCLGFVASFIDDRFVSRNEPLLEPAAELLGELLLDPVTRGGRFLQEYVEGEKANPGRRHPLHPQRQAGLGRSAAFAGDVRRGALWHQPLR